MFGKNKCKQCGMELEHDIAIKRDGNAFCSDSCANEHTKRSEGKKGSCC